MQLYDVVQVIALRDNRFLNSQIFFQRHPQLGDRGTILEWYKTPERAYEVECSDEHGITIWLEAMYPDEIVVILPAESLP